MHTKKPSIASVHWLQPIRGISKLGLDYPIPPEHTIWYPVLREQNDWTGRKLLKPAFGPWFFSHLIHLYSNRYFERFGEPVPIGRYPSNEEFTVPGTDGADDKRMTSKQVAADAVLALRSGTSVLLPSDREVNLDEAGAAEGGVHRAVGFEAGYDRLGLLVYGSDMAGGIDLLPAGGEIGGRVDRALSQSRR